MASRHAVEKGAESGSIYEAQDRALHREVSRCHERYCCPSFLEEFWDIAYVSVARIRREVLSRPLASNITITRFPIGTAENENHIPVLTSPHLSTSKLTGRLALT